MREIRLMSEGDLFEVAEIERLCFFEPWSQKSLELLLRDGNFGRTAELWAMRGLYPQNPRER